MRDRQTDMERGSKRERGKTDKQTDRGRERSDREEREGKKLK